MNLVSKDSLRTLDLKNAVASMVSTFSIDDGEFYGQPGQQHYRLLAHLASLFNGQTIVDIGTHRGSSALALATNPTNTIHSFDIVKKTQPNAIPNLHFHIADLWNNDMRNEWSERILGSALIVLDIDPHSGQPEYEFYTWLKEKGYKGMVLCDDIWYFKGMRDNFWLKIPTAEKLDITCLGHWSGTGILSFVEQPFEFETLLGPKRFGAADKSPWTIVTAYFDLTKMPDASPAIKARPKQHYLESAYGTLCLDQPLVVFCEEGDEERIRSMRPKHLLDTLKVYTVNFEDLPLTKYRSKIIENRIKYPYRSDDRNTASYYLLCMARYGLLQRIIAENPFNSTHFSWLNICIERMGYTNLAHLDQVFCGSPRDKFSTVYIDYIPEALLAPERIPEYFQFGRCSLCSGFFTGRADYMSMFCEKITEKFLEYVERGYGHADEQLFSPVYFENRDMFQVYYGDYQQMVTNYCGLYENNAITQNLLIPKSAAAGDWATCYNASKWIVDSVNQKKCVLTAVDMERSLEYYNKASLALGFPY